MKITRHDDHNLIELPKAQYSFGIFPNPATRNSIITIIPSQKSNGYCQVLSLSGQILHTVKINAGSEQPVKLNANFLTAGTYLIRFVDEISNQAVKKIIVQ